MKALSILQPFASLIALGLKDIENRSWPTSYRGDFLIHAGKGFDYEGWTWLRNNWHMHGLPVAVGDLLDRMVPKRFDRGGIIGCVELVDCVREHSSPWKADGTYGFVLRKALQMPFIPFRGALHFFEVPDHLIHPTYRRDSEHRNQSNA